MPTDEFFNTGIYTYLWIFNKNKPADRKDKVILINASELNVPLKKSKGKKRKEMDVANRAIIVDAFTTFKDNNFAKVYDKWHFYYNKQSIMLTNIDDDGNAIEMPIKTDREGEIVAEKAIKLNPTQIVQADEDINITEFEITKFDATIYKNLEHYFENGIKPLIAELDYKEKDLKVYTNKDTYYWYDADKDTIIKQTGTTTEQLGCGRIVIKTSLKKDSKTKQPKSIVIIVELTQDLQKDYEIIPYSPIAEQNDKNIADFMAKYITKPFEYIDYHVDRPCVPY
jgi:type I restriction enzyme M protein